MPDGKHIFNFAWVNYKSILRPPRTPFSLRNVPVKITWKEFLNRVYQLHNESQHDFSSLVVRGAPPEKLNDIRRRQVEFLTAVLTKGRIYSLPPHGGEGRAKYFQVLDFVGKKKVITGQDRDAEVDRTFLLALLQQLEVWSETPTSAEVFAMESPRAVDVLKEAPWKQLFCHMHLWQHTVSDIHGCTTLTNPTRAWPEHGVMDPSCPELKVMQVLTGASSARRRHQDVGHGAQEMQHSLFAMPTGIRAVGPQGP